MSTTSTGMSCYPENFPDKYHLMSGEEWRLGVQWSLCWIHYRTREPEPHSLLFRQPLPKQQQK
uniref:Cyclin-dependent kinases regulatory subunit n=1 Tax=Lynx canadensis TaxID=61383 RepID=A0A667GPW2_LYNCA